MTFPLLKNIPTRLLILLVIALLMRSVIAFSNEGTGDSGTWRLGGKTGLERTQLGMGNGTLYDGDCPTICSNWPPLTFHYMTSMRYIYTSLNPYNLPQYGYYKLLPFLSDVGIVVMVYLFAVKMKFRHPLLLATAYTFHPVAILISSYHGQRDVVWVFFSLLSVYLLDQRAIIGAASTYATGAAIKIPSLFFSPYLFFTIKENSQKMLFVVWSVFFFVLLSLPELIVYHQAIVQQVFFYSGWSGWWGLSALFQKVAMLTGIKELVPALDVIHRPLLYIGLIGINIFAGLTVKSRIAGVLMVILTASILTPSYASQYLIWPLPFVLLLPPKYTREKIWYSVLASFMAYNFYGASLFFDWMIYLTQYIYNSTELISYPMDTGIPLWIFLVFLLVKLLRDKSIVNYSVVRKSQVFLLVTDRLNLFLPRKKS